MDIYIIFLKGFIALILIASTSANITSPVQVPQYNSTIVATQGLIQPRIAQAGRTRFSCRDYACTAEKVCQTTIGGNCGTVCQFNCNLMINAGGRQQIASCSLGEKDHVFAEGSFVTGSTVNAGCNCKYCVCLCPYTIDNVAKYGLAGCGANVLCRLISSYTPGWKVQATYEGNPYPCRLGRSRRDLTKEQLPPPT